VTGNTCWLGTITVTEVASESETLYDPNDAPAGSNEYRSEMRAEYTVTALESSGSTYAGLTLKGRLSAGHERKERYDAAYEIECASGRTATQIHRHGITDTGSATRDVEDRVFIMFRSGGAYELSTGTSRDFTGLTGTGQYADYQHISGGCNDFNDVDTQHSYATTPKYRLMAFTETGTATDEDGILTLQGSRTFEVENRLHPTTRTVTWNLMRITAE
jgi:hypothetical protein